MRDFYKFMRHFQLINCRIVVHSLNELKCLLKGGRLEPSFDPKTVDEYLKALEEGNVKTLPMGAYEYSCCVEYLKKIRKELIRRRGRHKILFLEFSGMDEFDMVISPLEDCLEMVAKEVGFEVVDEEILPNKYQYTLVSLF